MWLTLEASLGEHALEAAATEGRVVLVEARACDRPGPSLPRYSSVHLYKHAYVTARARPAPNVLHKSTGMPRGAPWRP